MCACISLRVAGIYTFYFSTILRGVSWQKVPHTDLLPLPWLPSTLTTLSPYSNCHSPQATRASPCANPPASPKTNSPYLPRRRTVHPNPSHS